MQREATASTTLSPEERDRFIKTAIELANKLMKEAVKHQTAIKGVARRLTKESKAWFPSELMVGLRREGGNGVELTPFFALRRRADEERSQLARGSDLPALHRAAREAFPPGRRLLVRTH